MVTQAVLTGSAAKELGRALRLIRQARDMPLREVAASAKVSYQYLQNIEKGERTSVTMDVYQRLQRAYDLPDGALDDLILRARLLSALEERGVNGPHAAAIWAAVETHLNQLRYPVATNLAELVAAVIS